MAESEIPKQQTEMEEQQQEGSTPAKPDHGEEPAADQSSGQQEESDTLVSVWNGLRLHITTWEPTGAPV